MLNIEKIKAEKPIKELLKFSIINLDKPSGPTSFTVSQYVKNTLKLNKTSHLGTLDPMVSGVLPIALGRACRLNDYFMHRDKTYVGIMRLHEEVEEEKLDKIIKSFLGNITQLPPVRSRVKRAERVREIKTFTILERNGKDVLFETKVQAGTYIRKLIHDIGNEIGGAHMLELRRISAGTFEESSSRTLYDFDKAVQAYKNGDDSLLRELLIPAEILTQNLTTLEIKPEFVKVCFTGSPLFKKFLVKTEQLEVGQKICIVSKSAFIGCYRVVNEKEVVAVPEFVFN